MDSDDDHITGIILAGGKSRRMGRDKGMIMLNGVRMIEHVITAMQPTVSSILIVANDDRYEELGFTVVKDLVHQCGPLGGIYTGLRHSNTNLNIVVSCDIPFVSKRLLHELAVAPDDCDIVVPVHNGIFEPLCARYRKSCVEKMALLLEGGVLRMNTVLKNFQLRTIDTESNVHQFTNINTPDELKKYNNPNQ